MIPIFDFDGTIVNSLSAHADFYVAFGKRHGLGITRDDVFVAALGCQDSFYKDMGIPEKLKLMIKEEYKEDFSAVNIPVFPGMLEVLKDLRKEGYICLATYNRRKNIEQVRGIDLSLFKRIITRDNYPDKVEGLRVIADKCGVSIDQCVLIGDTSWDVKHAEEAGTKFLGVSWGWHQLQPCDKYLVAQTPKQIPGLLKELAAD